MNEMNLPTSVARALYSKQDGFTPEAVRAAFQAAVDVHTFVVYCTDPRAKGIPAAVAEEFRETWPGENILDENGAKIAFTATMGELVGAGGRAVDAVRSITLLNHLLNFRRVVVVHHTFCGLTAFTRDSVTSAYKHEHGHDLAETFNLEDMYIEDFNTSLEHDLRTLRNSPAVPTSVELYGYVFDINTGKLHKVIEDLGAPVAANP